MWKMIRTCTSWQDIKRPEQAFKLFLRFIIARALVMYGMELMTSIFKIVQGIIQAITESVGLGIAQETVVPRIHSTLGSHITWIYFYHNTFLCNDSDRIWKILQIVYVYSNIPYSFSCSSRRKHAKHCIYLHQELRRCMP